MQVDDRPVVSICIPTHNDSTVVQDALRSALLQTYTPLEIVIVDNHSADETWRIVTAMAERDSRVRCVRNVEDIGMARNFSACIRAAHGDYVLILCSDDVLRDGCVALLAAALDGYPDAVLAACGRTRTDQSLRPERVLRARLEKEEVRAADLLRECFIHGNRIGEPSAVMFRRLSAHRGFNADYSQALDLEMWFHLLGQGTAVLLPESLCYIRQHADQITRANILSGRIVADKRLLFRQYARTVEPSLALWEKLIWDARMASSAARASAAGGVVDVAEIAEIFCRIPFLYLFLPLARIAWRVRSLFTVFVYSRKNAN